MRERSQPGMVLLDGGRSCKNDWIRDVSLQSFPTSTPVPLRAELMDDLYPSMVLGARFLCLNRYSMKSAMTGVEALKGSCPLTVHQAAKTFHFPS